MNSMLRSPTTLALTKKLVGGQSFTFVRNAGGHGKPRPPGAGMPFPPGPKQFEQMRNWVSATVIYSAAGFTALCYFTDWKVVCKWIPFYNGKYKDDE